jgi:hypothetical protein
VGVPIGAQPSTFHIALAFRVVRRGIELHMGELDDLRIDIETLRTMINTALDNGGDGESHFLRACADVLYERRSRLELLERTEHFAQERTPGGSKP